MNKDSRIVELLHDLTQKHITVTFSNDFKGMLTVSWQNEFDAESNNHTHIGTPYWPLKNLEKKLINLLASILEESEEKSK